MKFLVIAAFIAVVVSGVPRADDVVNQTQWPWELGRQYRYDVESTTRAHLQEGQSSGSVFRAQFVIRVLAPGRMEAKLVNPQHAVVNEWNGRRIPEGLNFQPVQNMDKSFEILVEGGRVLSLKLSSTLSLAQENLLKGLIGALQVDLSTHRHVSGSQNSYDKQLQQGLFSKMETDVTGDCETLYTVSPAASEWRRELPSFVSEDPVEITKSKNYGHCHHRVAYHFGVPEGSEWTGIAHKTHEEQLIRRSTVSRILAGKQGHIYSAETTSKVQVHPHLYGKQKAEVMSNIRFVLKSLEQVTKEAWPQPEERRVVDNLLYSMTSKQVTIGDSSWSSSESDDREYAQVDVNVNNNRVRRSLKKTVSINKFIVKRSDDDKSSSSSSDIDSLQEFVNDDIPNNNEPAYAALYMNPHSRADEKQNPMNAQKLVQDIAQQLQNPNNMPKADFLAKFNILTRILASMTYDQLSQTSRSLEVAKSSNNNVKSDMWMVYRDAVAQTGTLPAFELIRNWIQTKKIQGEEAAQVVASLPSSLRYPTKEVMIQFFNLAMSDEVRQQMYLNNTALIAVTRLINMAQVNNDTAHNFYPTHMYGRLSRKDDAFVSQQILPRLSEELSQAISQEDSGKAQVYIKAIGNLGHPSILLVFAPYLEGKIPTTTYLRRQMVDNLEVLAYQRNKQVRSVLYSILKNTAENDEVRVAAIHNIMMTKPSSTMMLYMAQMTHNDVSMQVRACLKSAIESAAQLKHPRFLDLARTARAVLWMCSKDDFGTQKLHFSKKDLWDSYDNDYELGILTAFSSTGSQDSLYPKLLKYTLRSKSYGWNNANTLASSFSSIQEFIDYFHYLMSKKQPQQNIQVDQKFSAEKVAEMFNLKQDDPRPLEAAFYVNLMNQQRYFTFTKFDLEQLVWSMSQYFGNLAKGIERHYTKVINQAQVSIMFPVASGMPFIYKYKEPTVIHIQGKVKGQIQSPSEKNKDYSADIAKEIYFTYARNLDGSVGFMDTLADQYIAAGVVNKLQVNIPIKLDLQMKSGEMKISMEPLRPEQDQTILHYSVWPYTTSQKRGSLTTVSQDPNTKVITRQNKVSSINTKFGQSLGNVFQIEGYSYSSDYRNLRDLWQSKDCLSNIAYALYQKDVAMTHYNFKYLGKQSQNKRVTFTVNYDTLYNLKEKAQQEYVASNTADLSPNSEARRQELIKRVAAGINTAKAQVVDLSATFEGQQQLQYVLTLAMANSPVDPKIQYAFFAGKTSPNNKQSGQVNGVLRMIKPLEASTLNFLDALKKEMKTPFEGQITFGQNGKIEIQGITDRTKNYAELLQKHWIATMCKEEMARNNLYQDACHKAVILAHAPDNIKASITYKEVSPTTKAMIYQAYKMLENWLYRYTEVNPMKTLPDGKLEIEAQISYLERFMNLAIMSRLADVRMTNVPIPAVSAGALAIYTPIKASERVYNYYYGHQYLPYCTVDSSKVKTFSNRTYEYTLSPAWHVVMQSIGPMDNLVVLARRRTEKKQDIYVSYKSNNGMNFEMEIEAPESQAYKVKVNTNAKKVSDTPLTMYWDDVQQKPLLQYYTGDDAVFNLIIRENRLRALYDGERLVVLSAVPRGKTNGLCGSMTGSPRNDYTTPFGVVEKPEHFGASFAVNDGNMDQKTKQLQNDAKKQAYQIKNQYTAILRSDSEWVNAMESSEDEEWRNVYRSKSYLKERSACHLQEQVQYFENHGEICISLTPVKACQSHCRGVDYKIEGVQVTCRPKIDQQFIAFRNQIRLGESPKVTGVPKVNLIRIPTTCTA